MKIKFENIQIIDKLPYKVCSKEFPIRTDVNSINNHNCDSSISNKTPMYLQEGNENNNFYIKLIFFSNIFVFDRLRK